MTELEKKPKAVGRPIAYTEEMAAEICDRMTCGESISRITRDSAHLPATSTVYLWIAKDTCGFSERYVKAFNSRAVKLAEDILDIADDSSNDTILKEDGSESANSEFVNRSRLRVDSRKWLLSKMSHTRFGDKPAEEAKEVINNFVIHTKAERD
jgi:hypothetical protein